MIVGELSLQNFLGYRRRCSLNFRGKSTIGIVGANESGKSTLLSAIAYALYGRSPADREVELINDSADGDLLVELAVDFSDGSKLEIERGRTKSNSPILRVAGLSGKKGDLQESIAERLRLSYEDFIALTYFVQGDIHQFLSGNKREYFQRWTESLNFWRRLESEAGSLADRAATSYSTKARLLEVHRETLNDAPAIKAELSGARAEVAKLQERQDLLEEQRDALQAQQAREKVAEETKYRADSLREEARSLERSAAHVSDSIDSLKGTLKQVGAGTCPLLSVKCSKLAKQAVDRRKEINKRLCNEQERRRELLDRLSRVRAEMKRIHRALAKNTEHSETRADLAEVTSELSSVRRALAEAQRRVTRNEVRWEAVLTARTAIRKIEREMSKLDRTHRRLRFVNYMCGKSGVPMMLIDSELQRVEKRCNWILGRLDYPKRVRFRAYKELASFERVCPACGSEKWSNEVCVDCGADRPRKRRDEPTVTVLDGEVERPFALESGGARVLQSFAVRLAAGLFVSSMTGVEMRMVMLDEIFAMLDATNRQKLMGLVIEKLATQFNLKQQLVVSHHDDVVSAVGDLISVRKERGSSVATWV